MRPYQRNQRPRSRVLQLILASWVLIAGCGGEPVSTSSDVKELADADTSMPSLPSLTMGTNVPGASGPESFEAIDDGHQLDIVFGQQGLWMVVLALQLDGPEVEFADVMGELHVHDESVGSLSLKRQRLQKASDGTRYLLNFFLVLDTPAQGGQEGVVAMTLTPEGGEALSLVKVVQLVGGPKP